MRDYSNLLDAGVAAQLEKLKENEHKKGFEDVDIYYVYRRIHDEYRELGEEIFYDKFQNNIDYNKVRREAADIANFAHMIIVKCNQELNK